MDFTEHSFLQVFFIVLWILMPAYLSNTFAVITGGKFPIDQGKIHSDGNRILGDGSLRAYYWAHSIILQRTILYFFGRFLNDTWMRATL